MGATTRAYDHLFTLGLDDAADAFEDEDDPMNDHIDIDDLAAQYDTARKLMPMAASDGPRPNVVNAVDAYLSWWGRNGMRQAFRDAHGELVELQELDEPRAFGAWSEGYRVALFEEIAGATLDTYADMVNEDVASAGRPAANPAGEPITYWDSQGTWDAQHAYDLDHFNEDEIDAAVERVGEGADAKVEAKGVVAKYRADPELKKDWLDDHRDEATELGHDPEEAYKRWASAWDAHAVTELAEALAEIAAS